MKAKKRNYLFRKLIALKRVN